jgi:phosphoenolpyruvate carboxykinase (ATP)
MRSKELLNQYGITDTRELVYNPSYEQLFAEETSPANEGFERGTVTSTGAVAVDTGIFTGRSPKDKYIVCDAKTEKTVWWKSETASVSDNKPVFAEAWEHCKKITSRQLSGK